MQFLFSTAHARHRLHNTILKHIKALFVDLFHDSRDHSATIKSPFGSVSHILVKCISVFIRATLFGDRNRGRAHSAQCTT